MDKYIKAETHFDRIKSMDVDEFVDWVLFVAPKIARCYTQSTTGLKQYLQSDKNT